MSFLKNLLGKKEDPIRSYNEFWNWFQKNEKSFFKAVKNGKGYLYIGRQTANNLREIFYACKDFRKPSKLVYELQQKYADKAELTFDIFMDKYWNTFDHFSKNR